MAPTNHCPPDVIAEFIVEPEKGLKEINADFEVLIAEAEVRYASNKGRIDAARRAAARRSAETRERLKANDG